MMLSKSDTLIIDVLPLFTGSGVEVAFLVPTETGYKKSIMDATSSVRQFLSDNGLHDYNIQQKGRDHKVRLDARILHNDSWFPLQASLYRPETKNGDPRIWFDGLKKYCKPNNLLGLVTYDHKIYLFNLSLPSTIASLISGLAKTLLTKISSRRNIVADELTNKLIAISQKGYIKSVRPGPTGIGATLEAELGIASNSSRTPDYKGIEIKATRSLHGKPENRVTLFSQIPDWRNSTISNPQGLLDKYGYIRDNRQQLYCTLSALSPNTQGLFFEVDDSSGLLHNKGIKNGVTEDLVLWEIRTLQKALKDKHGESFFVKASHRMINGIEEFHYTEVVHTKEPLVHHFAPLINSGKITMDYTLSKLPSRVRDHGYLFKILYKDFPLLFPNPVHIKL